MRAWRPKTGCGLTGTPKDVWNVGEGVDSALSLGKHFEPFGLQIWAVMKCGKTSVHLVMKSDTNSRVLSFFTISRMYLEHMFSIVCVSSNTWHSVYFVSKVCSVPVLHQPSWDAGNAAGNSRVRPHRAGIHRTVLFSVPSMLEKLIEAGFSSAFPSLFYRAIKKVLYTKNLSEGHYQVKVTVRKKMGRDPWQMDFTQDTLSTRVWGWGRWSPLYRGQLPSASIQ